MDTDTWEAMSPALVRGYRATSVHATKTPHWWMLEIVDGFGAHLASEKAFHIRSQAKIRSTKEEGDSSHVNQAYDKDCAWSDKLHQEEATMVLRNSTFVTKGVVDQYGLVNVALYAVRASTPAIRICSFQRVNLQPSTRKGFKEWIESIKEFLEGGAGFDHDKIMEDKYDLLPNWWKAMQSAKKKDAMLIVSRHNGFTPACLKELQQSCFISYKMMNDFCVCYECAIENPSHLERDNSTPVSTVIVSPESVDDSELLTPCIDQVDCLQHNIQDTVIRNLNNFRLKPDGMTREKLFDHMIRYRELNRPVAKCLCKHTTETSKYLDVKINDGNKCVLHAKAKFVSGKKIDSKRNIMADSYGIGAKMKLARRKLDGLGNYKNQCCTLNSDKLVARRTNMMQLAASLAEVENNKQQEKEAANELIKTELLNTTEASLKKLIDHKGLLTKLFKIDLSSILFKFYGKLHDPKKHTKLVLMSILKPFILSSQALLGSVAAQADLSEIANVQVPNQPDSEENQPNCEQSQLNNEPNEQTNNYTYEQLTASI